MKIKDLDKVNEELDQSNQKLSNHQQAIYKGSKGSSTYYRVYNPYGLDPIKTDIISKGILSHDAKHF